MTVREGTEVEFYDPTTALRYNPLWLFVLSTRSVGKSYSFKKLAINTDNLITIWLRRTAEQKKDVKNWKSFISPLLINGDIDENNDYDIAMDGIRVNGIQKVIHSALSTDSGAHSMEYVPDVGYIKNRKETAKTKARKIDDEEGLDEKTKKDIIDAIDKAESQYDSKDRPKLKKRIVFEEFIEPGGRYLRNEVTNLFEFYMTVDRYSNTQLVGLGNNMSNENVYYEYFGIRPFTEEFKWYKNKTLLVQNVKLKGMSEFVKQQRFYNLVEGTDYADYLTDNKAWQDDFAFIEKRPDNSRLMFNFKFYNVFYGAWQTDEGFIYISTKHNKSTTTYAGLNSMDGMDYPFSRGTPIFKNFVMMMDKGKVKYDTITIRDTILDVVNGGYKNA